MTCGITIDNRIAGPCSECNEQVDQAHIITDNGSIADVKLYCSKHCPIHKPVEPKNWGAEPGTVSGVQEGLW